MTQNMQKINPRIYYSTIAFLEEKIEVYETTCRTMDPKDEASIRECRSRLDSCVKVLDSFKSTFIPGIGSNAPTGELVSEDKGN